MRFLAVTIATFVAVLAPMANATIYLGLYKSPQGAGGDQSQVAYTNAPINICSDHTVLDANPCSSGNFTVAGGGNLNYHFAYCGSSDTPMGVYIGNELNHACSPNPNTTPIDCGGGTSITPTWQC